MKQIENNRMKAKEALSYFKDSPAKDALLAVTDFIYKREL